VADKTGTGEFANRSAVTATTSAAGAEQSVAKPVMTTAAMTSATSTVVTGSSADASGL